MASHELTVKWNGKRIELVLGEGSTLGSLKTSLFEKTHVHPKRQKLLGLQAPGKTVTDGTPLGEFKLNAKKPIMMIGSSEEVIEETEKHAEVKYDVKDDFDVPEDSGVELELRAQPEVQERLQRRISKVEVKILNPPRPGKRCLVLDIDYTLFDLGSSAETPEELARPYLHEFLTAAYADYDIIIWSATSMKWVATKMKELRVLDNPDYKLVCMLDSSSMLTVRTDKYGVFDCKPLAFIWAKFPEYYNENNTIMLDDLRRNYVLNVPQGLVIKPYRHAHRNRAEDRELLAISKYLQQIAQLDDWSGLNHRHWRSFHPRTTPQHPTQTPEG